MVKRHGLRYDLTHQRADHLHGLWTRTEATVTKRAWWGGVWRRVGSRAGMALDKPQSLRVLCNRVLLRYERTKAPSVQSNRVGPKS